MDQICMESLDALVARLPSGGFYPEAATLRQIGELARRVRPAVAVALGGGPQAVVLAAMAGAGGDVWVLEHDERMRAVTAELLAEADLRAHLPSVELTGYDRQNQWYDKALVAALPGPIDILVIDGPGHFAGREPRWPAGPELFPCMAYDGIVVLDDAGRAKQGRALKRWASDDPAWSIQHVGGAAILQRADRCVASPATGVMAGGPL